MGAFDKEGFKNSLRKSLPGATEESIETYAAFRAKKYQTVKTGDNVIHLDYYSGLFTNADIEEVEKILSESNLELSRLDKSGILYASFDDFMLQVALFVSNKITKDVLLALGTSMLWDTIKGAAIYLWSKTKNATLNRYTTDKVTEKKVNFGLKISYGDNKSVDFKMDGNLTESEIKDSLDKILDLIKSLESESNFSGSNFSVYDPKKGQWVLLDINKEMDRISMKRKMAIKPKKRRK